MGVLSKIKDKMKRRSEIEKGSVRQKAFSSSLNAYYITAKELKEVDEKIREAEGFLKGAREERGNMSKYYSKESRERYSIDLNSNIIGLLATIEELKEYKKRLESQQKELSKIINASKKGKNTTINFGRKVKLYFKE